MNPIDRMRRSAASCTFQFAFLLLLGGPVASSSAHFSSVPAFEQVYPPNSHEAGELLLGELGCVNCHHTSPQLAERFTTYRGPNLDSAAVRISANYLRRFLSDPQTAHPGTRMPNLLAHLPSPEKGQIIQALITFLQSAALASRPDGFELLAEPNPDSGRALYHSAGCIACHEPLKGWLPTNSSEGATWEPTSAPSISLEHVPDKYNSGELARFLLDPIAVRPSARMPAFALTPQEAVDLESYLMPAAQPSASFQGQGNAMIQAGREHFARFRCGACHDISLGTDEEIRRSSRIPKPLNRLQADAANGCLSGEPSEGVPQYALSARQKAALRLALESINQPRSITAAEKVNRRMAALNCLACHERNGAGGPERSRAIYFESTGEDLGDEGRFPPTLTGVGRKLLPEALRAGLRGDGAVRPYMSTRMPGFGPDHADFLSTQFAAADFDPSVKPTPRDSNPVAVGRNADGRELVGAKGLSCIACHPLNGKRSLGIQAIDLVHAPKRLHPEWFRDYLLDPPRFRPQTRMPSFFPEGKSLLPGIGGDTERQIDSIWVYLNELDQSRLPEGMEESGAFELIPTNRPIIFRTFMKMAGMHAIALGFPEKLHAAFDSKQVRWTLAWKGKFLDAEGTWADRFAPPSAPLGDNVLPLTSGPPFAILNEAEETWPPEGGEARDYTFRGYRLDKAGCPAFLYQFQGVEITDTLRPLPNADGFIRVLNLRRPRESQGELWFRAALVNHIVPSAPDSYRLDDRWTLRLPGHESFVRMSGGKSELLLPVKFHDGESLITEEIRW